MNDGFLRITGVGSLPHHNVDSALEHALLYDLPFLPQLPKKSPYEFMIYQALSGLPGVVQENDEAFLDKKIWERNQKEFSDNSNIALEVKNYQDYLPKPETQSAWNGFLFELEERGIKEAKIQISGPITTQFVLRDTEGNEIRHNSDIASQIFRIILLKSLAMVRSLKRIGVKPILFIDEPALYALKPEDPFFVSGLQELKLMTMAIQKEDAEVGLHCCSNTKWGSIFDLGINYLSFDTTLSLASILNNQEGFLDYIQKGGKLILGVVPTNEEGPLDEKAYFDHTMKTLLEYSEDKKVIEKILSQSLLSPACGLALKTATDAENIYSALRHIQGRMRELYR